MQQYNITAPFEWIAIDTTRLLLESQRGNRYMQIIIARNITYQKANEYYISLQMT
jgi:hypothetical protein